MPIYDYHCAACDEVFERLILPSDMDDAARPECGSRDVQRMISTPALHNTSSRNDILDREYRQYRKKWEENAYMPKPPKKSKD